METSRHASQGWRPSSACLLARARRAVVAPASRFAQQNGTLYGTTEDVNGAPVAGIQVTINAT
jgi:hypothetical protein